jgi:hypothetical protein
MIGTIIPQVQAVAASASIVKNILAGLLPPASGMDALARINKDISGFKFDYIGEESVEAGTDITDHYAEDNTFMQDHRALKPTFISMRGFVSEVAFNKQEALAQFITLTSALATVTPYLGTYAPGTAAKMASIVNQTDQIIGQLTQAYKVYQNISSLFGAPPIPRVRQAYNKLDELRRRGIPFVVVTPWAVFGDTSTPNHGPMFIESLRMTSPDENRGWADIIVRMKEIRVAPSLDATRQENARSANSLATQNGVTMSRLSVAPAP